jgi:hypothetical protein
MMPTLAPPYTSSMPSVASSVPSSRAAAPYSGRVPGLVPQKTQSRVSSVGMSEDLEVGLP